MRNRTLASSSLSPSWNRNLPGSPGSPGARRAHSCPAPGAPAGRAPWGPGTTSVASRVSRGSGASGKWPNGGDLALAGLLVAWLVGWLVGLVGWLVSQRFPFWFPFQRSPFWRGLLTKENRVWGVPVVESNLPNYRQPWPSKLRPPMPLRKGPTPEGVGLTQARAGYREEDHCDAMNQRLQGASRSWFPGTGNTQVGDNPLARLQAVKQMGWGRRTRNPCVEDVEVSGKRKKKKRRKKTRNPEKPAWTHQDCLQPTKIVGIHPPCLG